jgi:hypothetical protein
METKEARIKQEPEPATELVSYVYVDRLCGLVVRVPGYKSRGPGSNSGSAKFPEK